MGLMKLAYDTTLKIARPLRLEARIEESTIRLGAFMRTSKVPDVPNLIWVEPTSACNLNCIMCDRKAVSRRKAGFMSFELFTKIANEAADMGVHEVAMGLGGEPLLHPRLIEMVKYVRSKGLLVSFNTNAELLSQQKSQDILEGGLDEIIFSVDGANKETYENIRLRGNYDITIKNIKKFLSLKENLKLARPKTILQTIIMKDTKDQIGAIVDMWHPLVDEVKVVPVTEYGSISGLSLVHGDRDSHKIPCSLLWFSMSVLWNGDVTICCNDIGGELVIGNALENDLGSLWNSNKLNGIRRIHRKGEWEKVPRCNKCEFINVVLIMKKNVLVSEVAGPVSTE